jgi:hypothetical protein
VLDDVSDDVSIDEVDARIDSASADVALQHKILGGAHKKPETETGRGTGRHTADRRPPTSAAHAMCSSV